VIFWVLVACYSGDLDLDRGFPDGDDWALSDQQYEGELPAGDTDEDDDPDTGILDGDDDTGAFDTDADPIDTGVDKDDIGAL
jgi:hypothetical protein